MLNPFVTRKNQLSLIFVKIQPLNDHFSGISNPQIFLRYLFSFPRCRENIGFKIFLTVYKLKFLIMLFLQCFKSSSSGFESVWFFPISYTTKKIFLLNKFFNSAHNILDIFSTNFDCCTQLGVEWGFTKYKLVLFFPPRKLR